MEKVLEITSRKEKIAFYIKNNPFKIIEKLNFDKEVECLHCGGKFNLIEFTPTTIKGVGFVSCKYFPICDGSILDF